MKLVVRELKADVSTGRAKLEEIELSSASLKKTTARAVKVVQVSIDQCIAAQNKYKLKETTLKSAQSQVGVLHRKLKTNLQRQRDVKEMRIQALESEVEAYHREQQRLETNEEHLRSVVADLQLRIQRLQRAVHDPDPAIYMGARGEEYSCEVFRFAAKCLVTGCTCAGIARLLDVFFELLSKACRRYMGSRQATVGRVEMCTSTSWTCESFEINAEGGPFSHRR
jgi:hypothetical protein